MRPNPSIESNVRPYPLSTSEFAKAAEVHRSLAAAFGPWCKRLGFERFVSSRCAYAKSSQNTPGAILAFEVQCSSFGNAEHGSMFALNAGAGAIDPRYLSGAHSRVLQYAPTELLVSAKSTEAAILASHPLLSKPGWSWEPGRDNWCQYYHVEHVRQWGEVLLPFLPTLLEQLLLREGLVLNEFGSLAPQA